MYEYQTNVQLEQAILKKSIWITIVLALSAIGIGIFTGSSSIIFDGMFSAVDCFFSLAAFLVSRLIQIDSTRQKGKTSRFRERFQYGFWHFEPMLLALNGFSLIIAVSYGFFESVNTIWRGGHTPDFGPAVWFAFIAALLCFGMAFYEKKRNKQIGSEFIALDIKSWFISGAISFALLIAFIFAFFIENTHFQWLLPYIDPIVLAIIAVIMAPMPIKTVIKAMREILMITPVELDEHVNAIVDDIVKKYGFVGAQNYLAKVGRSTMIEIHLILPPNYNVGAVETLDKIRSEIGVAIGDAGPDRWLTVSFTSKPEWAY